VKEHLDTLLEAVKEKPLPNCPGALEANVLRRVRLARTQEAVVGWWTLLLRPGMVAGALAMGSVSSLVLTIVVSSAQISPELRQRQAVSALDFGVLQAQSVFDLERK
jgi:hypothetical protein